MSEAAESAARNGTSAAREARLPRRHGSEQPFVVPPQEGYGLWAATYDLDANPLLALEQRLLTPHLTELIGTYVVDMACGTGRWLERLLECGAESGLGIDLSAAMLDRARVKSSVRGRLVQADLRSLPLPGGTADLVICSFAIGHFAEPGVPAAEFARVAKPGADVYVSDVHPEAFRRGWRTGFRQDGRAVEITTSCHPLPSLRAAFAAHGLDCGECIEGEIGESERGIFARAGCPDRFEQVRNMPAIYIARFKRTAPRSRSVTHDPRRHP